ncbi:hypothetical protein PTKIN_Ptkin04bG0214300 [Pterospermum kingtungense]
MDQIHHFLHTHPLILTEEKVNDEVHCKGCGKGLSGPIYGCSDCKFYLHRSCAELPKEIQNFLHPCPLLLNITSYTCNACFQHGSGFSYRCKRCDFDMHVECALRPTIESEGEELIHHFTHWHPLALVDQKNKDLEVRCGICDKLCYDSSGSSAYGCEECNFFLHKSCMINIPRQINHWFHPSCPLILLTTSSDECDGCDEGGSRLVFRCGKCQNFQLDVKCALLPTVESKGADKIQHSGHQHPLALRESMELVSEVRCGACLENCLGPCFVCERCDFYLHRQCALEFPQEIQHPFHPLHPLTLSPLPPDADRDTFQCPACRGDGDRSLLLYRCNKCDFNLHARCANPKLTPFLLKYGGHPHFLTYFDKTSAPFFCEICWNKTQSCFFQCVACQFAIHLHCLPSAPKTIKHKRHLHPLTLTRSPFQFELNTPDDWYNSDDEFYCDVCEEKRFKFEPVYYCEECKFIAEIRCVMSELFASLISQSSMTGKVISRDEKSSALEATIVKLNNEIAELRAKEKPLELEMEKLQAELEPIKQKLEELETDRVMSIYELNHNKKEDNYPTEASTSEGLPACLSLSLP